MIEQLTELAQRIVKDKYGKNVDVSWEYSKEKGHGDLSTAVALGCAKNLQQKPIDIATFIVQEIEKDELVERAEVAGPGYVNVWLTPQALLKRLKLTRGCCTPKIIDKKEKPVIIDYCGPNIAKPLGIHHILPHIIGQALVNLYKHQGINTVGWSYPGDWGTQFGKLYVAYKKWGADKKPADYTIDELLDLYVRFHQENDDSLEDQAREAFKLLEDGDKEMRDFWKDTLEVSKKSLDELYKRLGIDLDQETGESFYEDKMEAIIDEGLKKKVITEGEEGALIVDFPEDENMPPALLKKSGGSTLYATRDLAMVRYRIEEFNPRSIYYVVDRAQSLHFEQLFEMCRRFKWDLPELEHTVFGRMRFKDQKMSTRKGTVIRLEEVLDEAVKRAGKIIENHCDTIQTDNREELAEMMGIGALAYGVLSQNRKMDIVFDWDKFLSFEGNSAPYLQYTHARAKSVLRKSDQNEFDMPSGIDELTERERNLVNLLLQFAKVLEEAREARMPHILANYLFALSQEFNSFYNAESILKADDPSRAFRLSLTSFTASVLKTGAEILTIRVPERM